MTTQNTPFVRKGTIGGSTTGSILQRAMAWLKGQTVQAAVRRVYPDFAERHPEWVNSFFDEHFLTHTAQVVLQDYQKGQKPRPIALVRVWDRQLGPARHEIRQRRIADLIPVAVDFLDCLEQEL